MKQQSIFIIILCLISFNIGIITEHFIRYKEIHQPKVSLPEEYKLIDSTDTVKCYFDRDSVLQIDFNNHRAFN